VLAVAHCPDVRVFAHPDERAAGFLALGIAKASHRPAGLICTSGTAAANYLPSVIEARLSGTPLIVLTADRPPELRGTGAPQTIDQVTLYGKYPLYFCDLTAPGVDGFDVLEWEKQALEAVSAAQGQAPGPAHLNLPFREPLIPDPARFDRILAAHLETEKAWKTSGPSQVTAGGSMSPALTETWDRLASKLMAARRGLIICGPQNSHEDLGTAVSKLAAAVGYTILADVASQVRFGLHHDQNTLSHYDLCLRRDDFASAMLPDLVLRLGGLPTSKTLNEWLAAAPRHEHIIVSQHNDIADPDGLGTIKLTADLKTACLESIACAGDAAPGPNDYLLRWQRAEQQVVSLLRSRIETPHEAFEGGIVAAIFRLAPPGTGIFLSNSLPIRWAEFYAGGSTTPLRVFCNRGANGIDGVVSTAAGIAVVLRKPTVLVIGDIALIHDLNGLLAVRQNDLPLKIVLLNNDGGGIFSFLPIAAHKAIFEPLVAMPHGRDFSHVAAFWGIRYRRLESVAEFDGAFSNCLLETGPDILEIRFDRGRSLSASPEINRRMAAGIAGVS
jgi:2-succinyl-5-enolpyruvyl-6-hydroxy-3-cyclohexene-1-carboxylate synthase